MHTKNYTTIKQGAVGLYMRSRHELMKIGKLETGSRQDKTVLSAVVFALQTQTRQGRLVLSCPCRRCELRRNERSDCACRVTYIIIVVIIYVQCMHYMYILHRSTSNGKNWFQSAGLGNQTDNFSISLLQNCILLPANTNT